MAFSGKIRPTGGRLRTSANISRIKLLTGKFEVFPDISRISPDAHPRSWRRCPARIRHPFLPAYGHRCILCSPQGWTALSPGHQCPSQITETACRLSLYPKCPGLPSLLITGQQNPLSQPRKAWASPVHGGTHRFNVT